MDLKQGNDRALRTAVSHGPYLDSLAKRGPSELQELEIEVLILLRALSRLPWSGFPGAAPTFLWLKGRVTV